MTTAGTLELIADYYAAFNAEDDTALLALLSEDVAHDINQGGRELGKPAFERFLRRMRRCYREQIGTLTFCASAGGERGAAEYVVTGSYLHAEAGLPPAHGQPYELAGGAFFAIHAGKITRVTNYYNLQEWLALVSKA
jgi:steroid delta-isomerase-like uncharacterized protein